MRDMVWVGQLGIQVVLQTGTALEAMVPLLFKKFGVTIYRICQEPTVRSNILLNTTLVEAEHKVKREVLIRYQRARENNPSGVTLIFC